MLTKEQRDQLTELERRARNERLWFQQAELCASSLRRSVKLAKIAVEGENSVPLRNNARLRLRLQTMKDRAHSVQVCIDNIRSA